MSTRTVLVVEDDAHTRSRLAGAVEAHPELALAGSAGSCREARELLRASGPDVLLTDLGLPDGDGTDLIREARETRPETLAMVITVFGDERSLVRAIEAGATGYLLKSSQFDDVPRSILELLAGGSPISAPIARHLLRRLDAGGRQAATPEPEARGPELTGRETEVLSLVAKGFRFAEIAELLGISAHTVTTHVRHIYEKLEVRSRSAAVYEAVNRGLIRLRE